MTHTKKNKNTKVLKSVHIVKARVITISQNTAHYQENVKIVMVLGM
jgi:hypothetical protein